MRTLATLLEAASRRSATEVLLESGQRPILTTARGTVADPDVLPASELFDMVIAAVDDALQIELAVGNPVDFELDADGTWSVAAEPSADGFTVRAQRQGVVPDRSIELEPAASFGLDDIPPLPHDDEFEVDFEPGFSAAEPIPPRNRARLPDLDVHALDTPTVDLEVGPPETFAESAAHESGTWSLADEEDEDERDGFGGFSEVPRRPVASASAPSAATGPIGVPEDDDDEDPFGPYVGSAKQPEPHRAPVGSPTREVPLVDEPFTAPRSSAPAKPSAPVKPSEPAKASVPVKSPEPARKLAETPTRRELPPVSSPQTPTLREIPPADPPQTPTQRELPVQSMPEPSHGPAAQIAPLAASIPEGSLVFVREHGLADVLAESFAVPSTTVDDHSQAEEAWARIRGLPAGAIVIVRREDPSMLLGWILRRLEEGCRVFVETRARTLDGARRVLLGVGASERAERWLDSKVALVIEPTETGPRVL